MQILETRCFYTGLISPQKLTWKGSLVLGNIVGVKWIWGDERGKLKVVSWKKKSWLPFVPDLSALICLLLACVC